MIKIPEGVEVQIDGNRVSVKGKLGKIERTFKVKNIKIESKDGNIEVSGSRQLPINGTVEAHIGNMFNGVTTGFSYKLQAIHSHFPVSIEVKGSQLLIKNFIGEKMPRVAQIIGSTKVEVKGADLVVSGSSKDDVGQTCANIFAATRIPNKDSRIFQDGIYLIE